MHKLGKTGVQDIKPFHKNYDLGVDFVIIYGIDETLKQRVESYQQMGYKTALMIGLSWGRYEDYFDGTFDGKKHVEDMQRTSDNSIFEHSPDTPYIIPSINFSKYLIEKLKLAIDIGIDHIFLEEPEFFAHTGYSQGFKDAYAVYYRECWKDPFTNDDRMLKTQKLKHDMLIRHINTIAENIKMYGQTEHNKKVNLYIATHSLLNYAKWSIVSPEISLASSPFIDGFIGQVWTGTSRTQHVYEGQRQERIFEMAYLEYGILLALIRKSKKSMWFLQDPIEDGAHHTWDSYEKTYKLGLVAALLYPTIDHYEVAPWPHRIFEGEYPVGEKAKPIPPRYRQQLMILFNMLKDIKTKHKWVTNKDKIGVLFDNSTLFQRQFPNQDEHWWQESFDFSQGIGLLMPLLKEGYDIRPLALERAVSDRNYLSNYETIILSYETYKPSSPQVNGVLYEFVKQGGTLIYIGDENKPFQTVGGWWNNYGETSQTAAESLFETFNLPFKNGNYTFGQGYIWVQKTSPIDIANNEVKSRNFIQRFHGFLNSIEKPLKKDPAFIVRRGKYLIAGSVKEEKRSIKGTYVDLFNENLPLLSNPTLKLHKGHVLIDTEEIDYSKTQIIASSLIYKTHYIDNKIKCEVRSMPDVKGILLISHNQSKSIEIESDFKTTKLILRPGISKIIFDIQAKTENDIITIETK